MYTLSATGACYVRKNIYATLTFENNHTIRTVAITFGKYVDVFKADTNVVLKYKIVLHRIKTTTRLHKHNVPIM